MATAEDAGKVPVVSADGSYTLSEPVPEVDATLTEAGAPADAAAVGEAIEAITSDDSAVDGKPWTSKHIVDMLCPPLEASGNPVQCYPVAGYPLGVKAAWEPRQEGEGDPSPDNVRPIVGLDEVMVQRSGKNLVETQPTIVDNYEQTVIDFGCDVHFDAITVSFHCKNLTMDTIGAVCVDLRLANGTHNYKIWSAFQINGDAVQSNSNPDGLVILTVTDVTFCKVVVFWMRDSYSRLGADAELSNLRLELGSTATAYTPYTGTTATLSLPSTVYGGEVDVATGQGVETWKFHSLASNNATLGTIEENSNATSVLFYITHINGEPISNQSPAEYWICSHVPNGPIIGVDNTNNGIWGNSYGNMVYIRINREIANDIQELSEWLDAQASAGTPVTVAYKLATPQPITATGGQPIYALTGENVLLTNADSLTVTGRADPTHTIQALTDRIAALETAAVEGGTAA